MKKIMTLLMVLLLMFSMMLTGCGGGTEEPAATDEPAATEEPAGISKKELSIKYNEVATLYNEAYTLLNEKGIYGTEPETTEALDGLNSTMVELASAIEADDLSAENKQIVADSLDSILVELENMKTIAENM